MVLGDSEDLLDGEEPDQWYFVYHHDDRHEEAERVRRDKQIMISLVFHLAGLLPTLRKLIVSLVAHWLIGSLEALH